MTKPAQERFVLDANVFIQAKRRFYGLDFCPGYWDALKHYNSTNLVCSIDRVWEELEKGDDDLTDWAREQFGKAAFLRTRDSETVSQYRAMLTWVAGQAQYMESARHEFQQVADGWLVAFAKAHQYTVVTLEEPNSVTRKKVPIPNLCTAHGVPHITPFAMLRRLGIQLVWNPPA